MANTTASTKQSGDNAANNNPDIEMLRALTDLGVDPDTAWRSIRDGRDDAAREEARNASRSARSKEEWDRLMAAATSGPQAIAAITVAVIEARGAVRKDNLAGMIETAKAELEVTRLGLQAEAEGERAKLAAAKAKIEMIEEMGIELTPEQKAEMLGINIPRARVGGGLVAYEETTTTGQEVDYSGKPKMTITTKREVFGREVPEGDHISPESRKAVQAVFDGLTKHSY